MRHRRRTEFSAASLQEKERKLLDRYVCTGAQMGAEMKQKICLLWKKSLVLLAALGFFGLLYPEFCIFEDTCRVVYDTEHGGEAEVTEGTELYYSLLSAKPEDIKIKSGLLEWLSRYFNKME